MPPARPGRIAAAIIGVVLACGAAAVAWLARPARAAGLEGVVRLDGKPVAGVTIIVDPLRPWGRQEASVQTDASGRFSLAQAPWEWCRVAAASNDRYAVALLGPDRRGRVEFELWPPGGLEVELADEGGAPLLSAEVRLIEPIEERAAAERIFYASSAAQLADRPALGAAVGSPRPGVFRAPDLYPGRYFLQVRAAGFAETFFPLDVAAAATTRQRFVVARLVRAAGTVSDSSGQVLANASIEFTPLRAPPEAAAEALMAELRDEAFALLGPWPQPVSTATDARGAFDVELAPGVHAVAARRGEERFVGPELTAPAESVSLVVRPAHR